MPAYRSSGSRILERLFPVWGATCRRRSDAATLHELGALNSTHRSARSMAGLELSGGGRAPGSTTLRPCEALRASRRFPFDFNEKWQPGASRERGEACPGSPLRRQPAASSSNSEPKAQTDQRLGSAFASKDISIVRCLTSSWKLKTQWADPPHAVPHRLAAPTPPDQLGLARRTAQETAAHALACGRMTARDRRHSSRFAGDPRPRPALVKLEDPIIATVHRSVPNTMPSRGASYIDPQRSVAQRDTPPPSPWKEATRATPRCPNKETLRRNGPQARQIGPELLPSAPMPQRGRRRECLSPTTSKNGDITVATVAVPPSKPRSCGNNGRRSPDSTTWMLARLLPKLSGRSRRRSRHEWSRAEQVRVALDLARECPAQRDLQLGGRHESDLDTVCAVHRHRQRRRRRTRPRDSGGNYVPPDLRKRR